MLDVIVGAEIVVTAVDEGNDNVFGVVKGDVLILQSSSFCFLVLLVAHAVLSTSDISCFCSSQIRL